MVKKQATADNLDNIVDTLLDEEVLRFQLTNGLTVIAKENHSAEIVSTQLWVKTGSIHEDRFLGSGISHYVEHMLFKGTDKRDYKKISNDIHAKGANTNAYTTFDRTVYYIDG
ncbi:MAG: insulinase family protein, partial [Verrucomicrobia bacterium CG_4_9_14_3_um_filter_43_20]